MPHFTSFDIQNPDDQNEYGYPKTVTVVYVELKKEWNDIGENMSAPRHQIINQSIVDVFDQTSPRMKEIDSSPLYSHNNCSCCGGGLALNECSGCGIKFTDDRMRSGWMVPLPQKVVEFLKNSGHTFTTSVDEVWNKATEEFKQQKERREAMLKKRA